MCIRWNRYWKVACRLIKTLWLKNFGEVFFYLKHPINCNETISKFSMQSRALGICSIYRPPSGRNTNMLRLNGSLHSNAKNSCNLVPNFIVWHFIFVFYIWNFMLGKDIGDDRYYADDINCHDSSECIALLSQQLLNYNQIVKLQRLF